MKSQTIKVPIVQASAAVDVLLTEVTGLLSTLAQLESHRAKIGNELVDEVSSVITDCQRRMTRKELYVCVVGEQKVGKSTFLNALIGHSVLGTAVCECTGTVTYLQNGPRLQYVAKFVDGSTEEFAHLCPDQHDRLTATCDEASQRVQSLSDETSALPGAIEQMQKLLGEHESRMRYMEDEARTMVLQLADHFDRIETTRAGLKTFQGQLYEAGKDVPFYYRSSGGLLKPIYWLMRALNRRSIRPEWTSHFDKVRQLGVDRSKAKLMAKELKAGAKDLRRMYAEIAAQGQLVSAAATELAQLETRLIRAPNELKQWEARERNLRQEIEEHAVQRMARFQCEVRKLTSVAERAEHVTELRLSLPARRLPEHLVVMDTPGVNTESEVNRQRAWHAIRREADGCIVLSDLQQAMSAYTRRFIQDVRAYVPHLILVLTKYDRAIQGSIDDSQTYAEIDEARQIGEQRFAEEVGRHRSEILSFAVAAKPALDGTDPAAIARFEQDVNRLVEVLTREKALIIAARSAATVTECSRRVAEARQQAETSYRKQIALLEQQQIPDPRDFCARQLRSVESAFRPMAQVMIHAGIGAFYESVSENGKRLIQQIGSCDSAAELKSLLEDADRKLRRIVASAQGDADSAMQATQRDELHDIERPLLSALTERYKIASQLSGGAAGHISLNNVLDSASIVDAISSSIEANINEYRGGQIGGAAAGAAVGAAVGSFIPGLGTLIGGAVGGVVGWLMGPDLNELKQKCADQLIESLDASQEAFKASMEASESDVTAAIRTGLAISLDKAVHKYSRWIERVIADHQQKLQDERNSLSHLLQLTTRLEEQRSRLEGRMQAASEESMGIVRATGRSREKL